MPNKHRIKTDSPRFMREALSLLRGYAPEVVQCVDCGHPRLMGYACKTCDNREIRLLRARQEVLAEMQKKYPDVNTADLLKDIGVQLTPVLLPKITVRSQRRKKRVRDITLYKERMAALKDAL
jgi:hypothetical protein